MTVVVLLKQNSRCLSAHLPSPLSLSTPHDSKFSKPAPLPGLHIDKLGLRTSLGGSLLHVVPLIIAHLSLVTVWLKI